VDQLFQPLRRLANRVGDGLGLGLSIVQAIADAHLATITTQPRPDGGLSIEVGFPNARSGVAVSDPMSRGPCHNGPTIVVYGPTAG
jgi:signal transduction histidine kinase